MQLVFRLDSSNRIGSGHLMRCLALAEILRTRKAEVIFICRQLEGNSIAAIHNSGFRVFEMDEHDTSSLYLDAMQTIEILKNLGPIDWLVVDHYVLDVAWENEIRPYVKQIGVIDDLADREHDCDLLLDQNYYNESVCRYKNKVPKSCRVLIGPEYALLRPEFKKMQSSLRAYDGQVKQLLLFFGGNDEDNITQFILSALNHPFFLKLDIVVIVGRANPHRTSIQAYCENKNYLYYCGVNNMGELMAAADLAIGAGGSTVWERCCVGLPSIVVSLAYNQEILVKNALSANIFEYAGSATELDSETFVQQLINLISDPDRLTLMRNNGLRLVDGCGAERIANLLLESGL